MAMVPGAKGPAVKIFQQYINMQLKKFSATFKHNNKTKKAVGMDSSWGGETTAAWKQLKSSTPNPIFYDSQLTINKNDLEIMAKALKADGTIVLDSDISNYTNKGESGGGSTSSGTDKRRQLAKDIINGDQKMYKSLKYHLSELAAMKKKGIDTSKEEEAAKMLAASIDARQRDIAEAIKKDGGTVDQKQIEVKPLLNFGGLSGIGFAPLVVLAIVGISSLAAAGTAVYFTLSYVEAKHKEYKADSANLKELSSTIGVLKKQAVATGDKQTIQQLEKVEQLAVKYGDEAYTSGQIVANSENARSGFADSLDQIKQLGIVALVGFGIWKAIDYLPEPKNGKKSIRQKLR